MVLAVAGVACVPAAPESDDVSVVQGAVGSIVISGKVSNSSGVGLSGVVVTLAGSASTSQTTGAAGTYSFGGLANGSYSVKPTKVSCTFAPTVANLNNLKASKTQNFTGSGTGCAVGGGGGAGGTGGAGGAGGGGVTPITRKYLSIIYNPIIESEGNQRLIALRQWNNPATMTTEFVSGLTQGSYGLANYVQGPAPVELDEYPVKEDGFQYTDASFMACLGNVALCHKPAQSDGFGYAIDYLTMLNRNNVCARFNAGEFDELWMFGAPFMGFWEANQAGTQAITTNGPPVIGSACQGRLNILGFSYEAGVANMLHDYGHRIDGTMDRSLPAGSTLFTEFKRFDGDNPGQAQCGTTHRPPNSDIEYEYDNPRVIPSSADDWLAFPNRTGATTNISCTAWGCQEIPYHVWRMKRLPHVAGTFSDGSSNNWWPYILAR